MSLRKYIPIDIKQKLIYIKANNKKYDGYIKREEKKIILALAANYGNLGDIAITYAQKKFLEKNFPKYKIVEVPIDKTYENMKSLQKITNKNDIITIIGGGNFGDIYLDIERARQFFIKKFPKNKIICFPQTIDFSNDKKGRKQLKTAIKRYTKHKNLILFAREKKSYKIMKENFRKNKVYLVPDIVLSLNKQQPIEERKFITLCFRNDKENKINQDEKNKLIKRLKKRYRNELIEKDTHVGNIKIEENNREEYLEDIWSTFRKSKIVLTDRLHGMIFSVITGTPCIAFQNSNGKIKETYEAWLNDISQIEMISDDFRSEDIERKISEQILKRNEIKVIEKEKEYKQLIKELESDENE